MAWRGRDGMHVIAYLAANELQISGALGIAVAGTVLCTSLVGRVLARASVLVHSDEVESSIQTALDCGQVDIEGELVVHQSEHLVLAGTVHQVETGANVGTIIVLREELETQRITARGGAICLGVLGSLKGALVGTIGRRGARGSPLVAIIAVGGPRSGMKPTPVSIDGHLAVNRGTAPAARTFLPGQLRMSFALLRADLLGRSDARNGCQYEGQHFYEDASRVEETGVELR